MLKQMIYTVTLTSVLSYYVYCGSSLSILFTKLGASTEHMLYRFSVSFHLFTTKNVHSYFSE
jgi:hypothetical protein